jgi:hypothetical protein
MTVSRWSRRNGHVQVLERPLGPHGAHIVVRYRAPRHAWRQPRSAWPAIFGPVVFVLLLVLASLIVRGVLRWAGVG